MFVVDSGFPRRLEKGGGGGGFGQNPLEALGRSLLSFKSDSFLLPCYDSICSTHPRSLQRRGRGWKSQQERAKGKRKTPFSLCYIISSLFSLSLLFSAEVFSPTNERSKPSRRTKGRGSFAPIPNASLPGPPLSPSTLLVEAHPATRKRRFGGRNRSKKMFGLKSYKQGKKLKRRESYLGNEILGRREEKRINANQERQSLGR